MQSNLLKFSLIVAFVFFVIGCAHTQNADKFTDQEKITYSEKVKKACALPIDIMDKEHKNDYTLHFVRSEMPNASIDGSNIIITTGALSLFDDNELNALCAHEVAHKIKGHYGKKVVVSTLVTGTFIGLGYLIPGVGLLNHAVNPLVTKGFSRTVEMEADETAIKAMPQLALPKNTYSRMLKRLHEYEIEKGIQSDGGWLATHPALIDRIKRAVELESNGTGQH